MIQAEVATVYRGGRRRWFSPKTAAKAEAAAHYRRRHPCECEAGDDDPMGYPGYACDNHGEHRAKFVRRVARLLLAAPLAQQGEPT